MKDFLDEMKRYVGFTEADARLLVEIGPALQPHFPALAELSTTGFSSTPPPPASSAARSS
jgi:hypothetical protein